MPDVRRPPAPLPSRLLPPAPVSANATSIVEGHRLNALPDPWPFDQPLNCAVITLRQIADGHAPILHVVHDLDDHGWQFLTLEDANVADGCVICLKHVVVLDPSVCEVADLPPGWEAWRDSPTSQWQRGLTPEE